MKFLTLTLGALVVVPIMATVVSAEPLCYMQREDGSMFDLSNMCLRSGSESAPVSVRQPVVTGAVSTSTQRERSEAFLKAMKRGFGEEGQNWVEQNPRAALETGEQYCTARKTGMRRMDYEKNLKNNLYTEEIHRDAAYRAIPLAGIYLCPEYR
ncbi:MAG TPA: hypothetical protein IGS53_29740 [Leptolyngbyaceae cyanobacterium M33_DOE_097]|uniref:Uncharacterized protein n=1 Tax=Oscillatoriales cyanobacterium SpSt-418 TaxID=2282169 RepID=A0A7C3KEY1_9CYAN|nr:hypothetical protein [Leptolyngbyaceae cyanobacterium M33_DOE_097]